MRSTLLLLILTVWVCEGFPALESDTQVWWHEPEPHTAQCSWFGGSGTGQCVHALGHASRATGWVEEPHLRGSDELDPTFTLFETNRFCWGAPVHTGALGTAYATQSATRWASVHARLVRPRETPATQVVASDGKWVGEGELPVPWSAVRYGDVQRANHTHVLAYQLFTISGVSAGKRHPERFPVNAQPTLLLHGGGGQQVTLQGIHTRLQNVLAGPALHPLMALDRTAWFDAGYVMPPHRGEQTWTSLCGPEATCVGHHNGSRGCAGYGECEKDLEGRVCGGHGRCARVGHCHCDVGYMGNACNLTYTVSAGPNVTNMTCAFVKPCEGRGRCHDLAAGPTCECLPGWTGSPADTFDSWGWYASHLVAEGVYGVPLREIPSLHVQVSAARWTQQCVIWTLTNTSDGYRNETFVSVLNLTADAKQPVRPYSCQRGYGGTHCVPCDHCDPDHSICVDPPAFRYTSHVRHTGKCLCDAGYTHLPTSPKQCDTPRCPLHPHTHTPCGMPRYGRCDIANDELLRAAIPGVQNCSCAHGYGGAACETALCPVDSLGRVCGYPDRDPHLRDVGVPPSTPTHHVPSLEVATRGETRASHGVCDVNTGTCVCAPPYMGAACGSLGCARHPSTRVVCGGEPCDTQTLSCNCSAAQRTTAWDPVHRHRLRVNPHVNDTWGPACEHTLGEVCRPPRADGPLCSGVGLGCEPPPGGETPVCWCPLGRSGTYCERDACDGRCGVNGTCVAYCRDAGGGVQRCTATHSWAERSYAECECNLTSISGVYVSEACTAASLVLAEALCVQNQRVCTGRGVCRVSHNASCTPCDRGFNGSRCEALVEAACESCNATARTECDGVACRCRPTFSGTDCLTDRCVATGGAHTVPSTDARYGRDCACPANATWYQDPGGNHALHGCRWLCGSYRGHECGDPYTQRCGVVYAHAGVLTDPVCGCSCTAEDTNVTGCTTVSDTWSAGGPQDVAEPWIATRNADNRSVCEPLCAEGASIVSDWCACSEPITDWTNDVRNNRCFAQCNGRVPPRYENHSTCVCTPMFTGTRCEVDTCAPGGTFDVATQRCACAPGYAHEYTNDLRCVPRCLNGATWNTSTGVCDCVVPFWGDRCEQMACARNGEWNSTHGCLCDASQPGYGGPYCLDDVCVHGNASVHNGTCLCDLGASGHRCETTACGAGGAWSNTTRGCVCTLGYHLTAEGTCGHNRCFPGTPVVVEDDSSTIWYCDCPADHTVATDHHSCVPQVPPTSGTYHAYDWNLYEWLPAASTRNASLHPAVVQCTPPATTEQLEGFQRCGCDHGAVLNGTLQNYSCWDACSAPSSAVTLSADQSLHATEISVFTECDCDATRQPPPFRSCGIYPTTATTPALTACRAWVPILSRCAQILNHSRTPNTSHTGIERVTAWTHTLEQFLNYYDHPAPTLASAALVDCACDPARWPHMPSEVCPHFPCRRGEAPLVPPRVTLILLSVMLAIGIFLAVERSQLHLPKRQVLPADDELNLDEYLDE